MLRVVEPAEKQSRRKAALAGALGCSRGAVGLRQFWDEPKPHAGAGGFSLRAAPVPEQPRLHRRARGRGEGL